MISERNTLPMKYKKVNVNLISKMIEKCENLPQIHSGKRNKAYLKFVQEIDDIEKLWNTLEELDVYKKNYNELPNTLNEVNEVNRLL